MSLRIDMPKHIKWFWDRYYQLAVDQGTVSQQDAVDIVRMDSLISITREQWRQWQKPEDRARIILPEHLRQNPDKDMAFDRKWEVMHIWFPENRVSKYEIRGGNPPSDSERPQHLRGLFLELDPKQLGKEWLWELRPGGMADDMIRGAAARERYRPRRLDAINLQKVRMQ